MNPVKIGFVGVGDISGIYLENITKRFQNLEVIGVCDLVREKAERAQKKYGIPKLYDTMHDLFADKEVDIVLNLTRPYEHYDVSLAALQAGKPVYSEKPLAATLEQGQALVALAKQKNLLLGGAPDTFLGAGIQTCRQVIDEGKIGRPIGAAAFMICRGHETWHPDPAFYYQFGGGPMLDMGPYYLTALVNLLGPVASVSGIHSISFPQRTITSEPLNGTVVDVQVPTNIHGLLEFACGAVGSIYTTFDVHYTEGARLEIYGEEGTLCVPDPNNFDGEVLLLQDKAKGYQSLPRPFAYKQNSRALGLADMASALQTGRTPRAGYQQTLHVLEIMSAVATSAQTRRQVDIHSGFERLPPMAAGLADGEID